MLFSRAGLWGYKKARGSRQRQGEQLPITTVGKTDLTCEKSSFIYWQLKHVPIWRNKDKHFLPVYPRFNFATSFSDFLPPLPSFQCWSHKGEMGNACCGSAPFSPNFLPASASFGAYHLFQFGVLCGLQRDTFNFHGLQRNFCSSGWSTSSLSSYFNLLSCFSIFFFVFPSSPLCSIFPFLECFIRETSPTWLIGSTVSFDGSVLDPAASIVGAAPGLFSELQLWNTL